MMRSLLTCCLIGWLLVGCDRFGPETHTPPSFDIRFGTAHFDEGRALLQASGGDLLVAGAGNGVIAPADGTLPTPSLTRIDPTGTLRWTRTYDALTYGTAVAVLPAASNRFLLLVTQHDESFRNHRLALWHTDADGALQAPVYERPNYSIPFNATQPALRAANGDYLLVLHETPGTVRSPGIVLRLDADGNEIWQHATDSGVEFTAIVETNHRDLVTLGSAIAPQSYQRRLFLLGLTSAGAVRWTRELDKPLATAIAPTADGGFLLAGVRESIGEDHIDAPHVMKVDAEGALVWERTYPDLGNPISGVRTYGLAATADGPFVLTGRTSSSAFILNITPDGEPRWSRTISGADEIVYGRAALQLADGPIAVTGARGPDEPSFGGADFDTFVLTVDQDGSLP